MPEGTAGEEARKEAKAKAAEEEALALARAGVPPTNPPLTANVSRNSAVPGALVFFQRGKRLSPSTTPPYEAPYKEFEDTVVPNALVKKGTGDNFYLQT